MSGKNKGWEAMYENVCGSRRLLEGNLLNHMVFIEELARVVAPGDRVLEVGAGTGVTGWPLAEAGCQVVTLDNDPGIIKMAKINISLLGARIEVKEGDGFNLPYEADSFNMAFSQGLMEHYTNDEIGALLREQLRVAPVVVMCVPLKGCADIAKGDERMLTEEEWKRILEGMWVAKWRTYHDGDHLIVTITRGPTEAKD